MNPARTTGALASARAQTHHPQRWRFIRSALRSNRYRTVGSDDTSVNISAHRNRFAHCLATKNPPCPRALDPVRTIAGGRP